MSDDEGVVTQSFSFQVGPDTRTVHDDAVEAYDNALGGVGDAEVMHFMDPQRINAFSSGGPPVWSVGTVAVPGGTLYLTYGWSQAIDPAQEGLDFELSIRTRTETPSGGVTVPQGDAIWPALFLRALCRYMLQSRRLLEVGQAMPFPGPITSFFAPPEERAGMPSTEMNGACFVEDPLLPRIETPRGAVQVRRVLGIYPQESQLMELWSVPGFTRTVAAKDPTLATDIGRSPLTTDQSFVDTILHGSAREGSQVPYVATPGVAWSDEDGSLRVKLPGGAEAGRIRRMLEARLPFGRHLLVHDIDPSNPMAIGFEPSEEPGVRADGATLILSLPPGHELFGTLDENQAGDIVWKLS